VIRSSGGDTLASEDYSSPRGANGYYVMSAKWSPDSQFLVYSLSSSGGHQPWSFPTVVYSRKSNAFAKFNAMIGDQPTVSGDFEFSGPHSVTNHRAPLARARLASARRRKCRSQASPLPTPPAPHQASSSCTAPF
jgi:hypothetical protein